MGNKEKLAILFTLSFSILLFTAYCHLVLDVTTVFTHLFYIPIVLAAMWYSYRGVGFTFLLFIALVSTDAIHGDAQLMFEDCVRGSVMISVSFFIAVVVDHNQRLQAALTKANSTLEGKVSDRTRELSESNQRLNEELKNRDNLEHMIVEEKERLKATLFSIGDAIVTTDAAGNVTLMNHVAETIFDSRAQDSVGRPLNEIVRMKLGMDEGGDDWERQALSAEAVWRDDRYHIVGRADGSQKVLAVSSAPIIVDGIHVGTVLAFSDVTEKEQLRDEWARLKKIEAMELLAGGIAHDFNNLLTAIGGRILIAKHDLDQNGKAYYQLGEAEKGILRATDLTRQLLNFAKTGSPVRGGTNVHDLIIQATDFALTNSTVQRSFDISPDLWPVALDSIRFGQIVSNLIINAKEAMPNGGTIIIAAENLHVESDAKVNDGDYIHMVFKDDGVGIPAEALDHIFEPYYTTKPHGSGLGLAIVNSIIVKQGGRINIDSSVGKGTSIDILLPAWNVLSR